MPANKSNEKTSTIPAYVLTTENYSNTSTNTLVASTTSIKPEDPGELRVPTQLPKEDYKHFWEVVANAEERQKEEREGKAAAQRNSVNNKEPAKGESNSRIT
jgi:hypothetical protein